MPGIKKHVEKICFHCVHFAPWWKQKEDVPGAPAKCLFWNKAFPDHNAWIDNPVKKKPGDRTCKNWEG